MSQPFQTGTVVYLKAGSPPMTVNGLRRNDGLVTVEWFDASGLHREAFDHECIFEETPALRDMRHKCLNNMRALLDVSAKVMVEAEGRAPEVVA